MSEITEKGMYFAKDNLYKLIQELGGQWGDKKKRPIVTLIQSRENPEIYWAIPMGDYNHRDQKQKARLERFLNAPSKKIESCFYHIGKTHKDSIFFVSKVIPITKKYIQKEYIFGNKSLQYVIKNKNLINELERKVSRILSYEKQYLKTNGKHRFEPCVWNILDHMQEELAAVNSLKLASKEIAVAASVEDMEPSA